MTFRLIPLIIVVISSLLSACTSKGTATVDVEPVVVHWDVTSDTETSSTGTTADTCVSTETTTSSTIGTSSTCNTCNTCDTGDTGDTGDDTICVLVSVGVDTTTALTPQIVQRDYFDPHSARCSTVEVATHLEAEEVLTGLLGTEAVVDMVHNPDPRVQQLSLKPDGSWNPGACWIHISNVAEAELGKGYLIGTRAEITPQNYQSGLKPCPIPAAQ